MKKTAFILILLALFSNLNAQNVTHGSASNKGLFDEIDAYKEELPVASYVSRYRLYSTKNNFNFIKLDTRTGIIAMVQWSFERNERFEWSVSSENLTNDFYKAVDGRFELVPTENYYNFLLLDKIDGRVWLCQWSFKADENFLIRIYHSNLPKE